jgi:UDPglucose--hexose-1-phosphate uridylyltransferase
MINAHSDVDSESIKETLEGTAIPFMHYGIINKYNFADADINAVPIKRWDPLSYNPITLNEFGYQIILTKRYGHYSYISPIRAARPFEQKESPTALSANLNTQTAQTVGNNSDTHCPIDLFEPMLEGKNYPKCGDNQEYLAHTIVLADGTTPIDNPFSEVVKTYRGLRENAVCMLNKYPAMARVIDYETFPIIENKLNEMDKNAKVALGVCFLTVPRRFYEKIEDIPADELKDLLISMSTGIKLVIDAASKQKAISIIPISPFFNLGRLVGGSMKRIHSQVYMDLSQDGHGSRLESILKAFENMKKSHTCELCNSNHGEGTRIVIDSDDWIVFASASPIRNYHLRFAPKQHIENIYDISSREFLTLSKILKVLFLALNDLDVNPNRNIVFNTRPYGYDKSFFHVFGDILPYEFVGGAEMSDDMRVVRIAPKTVAGQLREIIQKKYGHLLP